MTMKFFVFVDGSFANNEDLTSQIGFIIVLGNETRYQEEGKASIWGNIIHWSSTKCKRVTRSTLASEIYGMVSGFDYGYVLKETVRAIARRLDFPQPPLVLCTDSYSLYECLVKMGTTIEKRLMIDIMGLRESYEGKEIDEVRWIQGDGNPADAMTKASPNRALEALVERNSVDIQIDGWVER